MAATDAPARRNTAVVAGLPRRDSGWRLPDVVAVAVPAALAAVLCFLEIGGRSLGFDEAATVTIASQHGSALWTAIAHDGGNMSGYYLVLHLLIGAFGSGLVAIRFVSALAVIATVALIGVIGLRLFNRRVAFVAGVLGAVSLPLVYWAQNARGYAPMVAFVCAAFVAFIALVGPGGLGQRASGGGRRWYWIAYVVFMVLAVYSSFVAILVVPVQLMMVIRRRALALRLVAALVVVAVLLHAAGGAGHRPRLQPAVLGPASHPQGRDPGPAVGDVGRACSPTSIASRSRRRC